MEKERIRFLENIAADGFVGLEEIAYDGWELRFTQGYAGRANSVQIREDSTIGLAEKVDFCEKAYAEHGLPCMFKLTDSDVELITFLENRGYQKHKPTDVMLLALGNADTECEMPEDVCFSATPENWFESYFAFEGLQDETKRELTGKIHAKVSVDQVYIRVMYKGNVAAVASLAIENGYSLLHNVVVKPGLRGLGLGKKLCQAAIMKSRECGATHIFLQVMQNNPVAVSLYKKLGFEKQYTYYYLSI
ncbi:MAG: GNAT family N-acetyltransferase [Lachnospiraceae bacterium]|nr:GNAT family N-acetyltransferase [Lachnospiraceae bacterium]